MRVVQKSGLTPYFVSAQPGFSGLIDKLVATTDGVIIGHSRNISASSGTQRTQSRMSPVTLSWSVSQRTSRGINIQAVIECVTSILLLNFTSHTARQGWTKPWVDYVFQISNSTRLLAHIGYWRRLGSSEYFAGQTLANCVEVIHSDIVGVWNLPDEGRVCLLFIIFVLLA